MNKHLHPIITFLADHPERTWTAREVHAELPDLDIDTVRVYLSTAAGRGDLARTKTSLPSGRTGISYCFVRLPLTRREALSRANAVRAVDPEAQKQTRKRRKQREKDRLRARRTAPAAHLQPALPGPWGEVLGLFLANPQARITAGAIGLLLNLRSFTLSMTLQRFERQGLVRRRKDRRITYWSLIPGTALTRWAAGGEPLDLRTVQEQRRAGQRRRVEQLLSEQRTLKEAQALERQQREAARTARREAEVQARQAWYDREALRRQPRPLNPTNRDLHPTLIVALLLSNPDTWVDAVDVQAQHPEVKGFGKTLAALAKKGHAERRQGERGNVEYRLLRAPTTHAERTEQARVRREAAKEARMSKPQRVRVQPPKREVAPRVTPPPKPRPARAAKPRRARPTPAPKPAPTPEQLARRAEQEAQRQVRAQQQERERAERALARQRAREQAQAEARERREAQLREQERLNREIQQGDVARVRAWITTRPGQEFTEADVLALLGTTVTRVRAALRTVEDLGYLQVDRSSSPTRYRPIDPGLPAVPAALTAGARRVLGALTGRPAETELGLMHTTGYSRDEVRAGLARLHALGVLGWAGVGHLILYRLTGEVQAKEEAA